MAIDPPTTIGCLADEHPRKAWVGGGRGDDQAQAAGADDSEALAAQLNLLYDGAAVGTLKLVPL
jgi:hypothetical protein